MNNKQKLNFKYFLKNYVTTAAIETANKAQALRYDKANFS